MGILVMSGYFMKISAQGLTDSAKCAGERAGIGTLTTCLQRTTHEVNWHRHMTRVAWLLITAHVFESGTASKYADT